MCEPQQNKAVSRTDPLRSKGFLFLYEGQPFIVFRLQLIGQESLLLNEFTLLNLLIQMVVSSKNILINTLKIMFGKISGHLFSESG